MEKTAKKYVNFRFFPFRRYMENAQPQIHKIYNINMVTNKMDVGCLHWGCIFFFSQALPPNFSRSVARIPRTFRCWGFSFPCLVAFRSQCLHASRQFEREIFTKAQTCCFVLPKIPNAHRTYFVAEWKKFTFSKSAIANMRLNLRTVV